ncbi:hypothetical protein CMO92_02460 [Candidatus Woesearchaeota archaeon]|nr:hypothetical protein [Candidatus Woesearchaeota archaeon]
MNLPLFLAIIVALLGYPLGLWLKSSLQDEIKELQTWLIASWYLIAAAAAFFLILQGIWWYSFFIAALIISYRFLHNSQPWLITVDILFLFSLFLLPEQSHQHILLSASFLLNSLTAILRKDNPRKGKHTKKN